jgi:hypothetical protein
MQRAEDIFPVKVRFNPRAIIRFHVTIQYVFNLISWGTSCPPHVFVLTDVLCIMNAEALYRNAAFCTPRQLYALLVTLPS